MTHRIIIVENQSIEVAASIAASGAPRHKVTIEFRPDDDMNPVQIGHEIARLERLADKIISGTD